MKLFIGGEVEHDIYDSFRAGRNKIMNEREKKIQHLILDDLQELSFYIYILKDISIDLRNRFSKKNKRLEVEVEIPHTLLCKSQDSQKSYDLIKNALLDRFKKYNHKDISINTLQTIYKILNQ